MLLPINQTTPIKMNGKSGAVLRVEKDRYWVLIQEDGKIYEATFRVPEDEWNEGHEYLPHEIAFCLLIDAMNAELFENVKITPTKKK